MSNSPDNFIHLYEDGLISVAETANFLGVSRSSLYSLMDRGNLIYAKFGKSRRIPKRALIQFARANQQGGWNAVQA